jgi:hypothetical protein
VFMTQPLPADVLRGRSATVRSHLEHAELRSPREHALATCLELCRRVASINETLGRSAVAPRVLESAKSVAGVACDELTWVDQLLASSELEPDAVALLERYRLRLGRLWDASMDSADVAAAPVRGRRWLDEWLRRVGPALLDVVDLAPRMAVIPADRAWLAFRVGEAARVS